MFDGSYSGGTQYLLTPTQPVFLKALFVREGMSDIYRDIAFRGGAYQLVLNRGWTIDQALAPLQQGVTPELTAARTRLEQAAQNKEQWYRHLPLNSCPPLEGIADWYFPDLAHPEDGLYWWPTSLSRHFHEVDARNPLTKIDRKKFRSCVSNALKDCLKAAEADGTNHQNNETPA